MKSPSDGRFQTRMRTMSSRPLLTGCPERPSLGDFTRRSYRPRPSLGERHLAIYYMFTRGRDRAFSCHPLYQVLAFFLVKCSLAREHNRDTILMQITICGSASRFKSIFHVHGRLQMSFFWLNRPKKTRTSLRTYINQVFLEEPS